MASEDYIENDGSWSFDSKPTPMNPQIQQHLDKFAEEFPLEDTELQFAADYQKRMNSFLEQALQSTWNAAVKDTVEKTKLQLNQVKPWMGQHEQSLIHGLVADQNELINKLDL